MSFTPIRPVHDDEPAVTNAALAELVSQVRRLEAPDVSVTAEQVRGEYLRRRGRRRVTGLAATLSVAAAAVAFFSFSVPDEGGDRSAVVSPLHPRGNVPARPSPGTEAPSSETDSSSAADVVATADRVAPAGMPDVTSGGELSGPPSNAVLLALRVAAWVSDPVIRTEVQTQMETLRRDGSTRGPTASSVARKAEALLTAGDRRGAIKQLRTLVRKFPRSSQARTGLVDLARLYKANGQTDRARCAYETYLDRWPIDQMHRDVERALAKLPAGATCRGLEPKK